MSEGAGFAPLRGCRALALAAADFFKLTMCVLLGRERLAARVETLRLVRGRGSGSFLVASPRQRTPCDVMDFTPGRGATLFVAELVAG